MKKIIKIHPVAKYYWCKARTYPKYLFGILIVVPLTIIINNYLPPIILANVLDRLSTHNFQANNMIGGFGKDILIYGLLLFTGAILWRVVDYFMWRLEINVQQDIAEEVFNHLTKQSASFHANHFGGSLVSANNKLLGSYIRFADTTIFMTYPLIIGLITVGVILWPKSPLYVISLLIGTLVFIAGAVVISKPVRKLSAKSAKAESRQTGFLADAVTNIMAIKSFARSKFENRRFHRATNNTRQKMLKFSNMHRVQMNIFSFISRAMSLSALIVAVIGVVTFKANIAVVFLIFSYTTTIIDQLFTFTNNGLRNYSRAFGDGAEMVGILSRVPEVLDPKNPEPVQITSGNIKFKDITFRHDGSDSAIFNKLNLTIKHGEKVGLVGHSGSGKSTLIRLLLRFSDIDSGAIEISNQNIAKIKQDDLHEYIAYVPQEPLLFHRTLAENIAYGNPEASQKEIEAVAKMAYAHEFIKDLPDGYNTLVGERGVKLSGGQRQRVAIARTMIKNAPIIVLDEATSALDSESEALIQDALWKLMQNKTAIVVAHRLSTIQKMDRIIVLDNGKIIEEGSHIELINKQGKYADLWSRQSGGFIED